MFSVVVTEKGGEQQRLEFDKPEVTIGRVQGNDIILPKGNVSKRHSRIVLKDSKFIIVDLKSTNGTYVNGRKITSPIVVKGTDKIYIGDFILTVEEPGAAAAVGAPPPSLDRRPPPPPPPPKRPDMPPPVQPGQQPMEPAGSRGTASQAPQQPNVPMPPPMGQQEPLMSMPDMAPPPQPNLAPPPQQPNLAPPPQQPDLAPPPQDPMAPQGFPPPQLGQQPPPVQPAPDFPNIANQQQPMGQPPQPQMPPPVQQPMPDPAPPPVQEAPTPQPLAPPPQQQAPQHAPPPQQPVAMQQPSQPGLPAGDPRVAKLVQLQKEIHDRLIESLDLRRMDMERLADEELWEKTENTICDIVESLDGDGAIPAFVDQDTLIKDVLHEALGLGPLEDLLADDSINEIMVNHSNQIYVEQNGSMQLCDKYFSSDKAVLGVIERIVAPLGRRIDESSPLVDARLKDGSRVNAIIPPLAIKGPCITIRKFRKEAFTGPELVQMGSLSQGMMEFLEMCVEARKNIIISGGTGSGKTTTLNVVSNFIPESDRIVTIEDAAELQLVHDHWVQLESRPPNIEGKGAIVIRDLVRNSLRMRPDRIIVGECRGGESLDMLQAMNTGHDGSLTTAHSNGPRDTLARLETMVLMSGMELPVRAIREQVASAIDIIAHQTRFSDGTRKVTHITEISGMEGDVITMQDIFLFKQEGFDEQGRVAGRYVPSGFVPRFYEDLRRRGLSVNMNIFRE